MTYSGISALALVMSLSLTSHGQLRPKDSGVRWTAFSRTAQAITGDITFSPSKIVFANDQTFDLSYLGSGHGVSLIDGDPLTQIFRILKPRDVHLLGGNTLCGGHLAPTYLSMSQRSATKYELMMMGKNENDDVKMLFLTVISGTQKPSSEIDRLRLCSSYTFTRD